MRPRPPEEETRVCAVCRVPKPLTSGYYANNSATTRETVCRTCRNSQRRPAAFRRYAAYVRELRASAGVCGTVLDHTVTRESLAALVTAQRGLCAWTSARLVLPDDTDSTVDRFLSRLPASTRAFAAVPLVLDRASVFGIGNLAFVAYAASLLHAMNPVFSDWAEFGAGLARGTVDVKNAAAVTASSRLLALYEKAAHA